MKRKASTSNVDAEVISCLEHQIISTWERYGMGHLAVSAESLSAFQKQPLSEQIHSWEIKRKTNSVPQQKRTNRGSRILKSWPQEDQITVRFPDPTIFEVGKQSFSSAIMSFNVLKDIFFCYRRAFRVPLGRRHTCKNHMLGKNVKSGGLNRSAIATISRSPFAIPTVQHTLTVVSTTC